MQQTNTLKGSDVVFFFAYAKEVSTLRIETIQEDSLVPAVRTVDGERRQRIQGERQLQGLSR